ncbi:hypothetical protein EV193_106359 [Herbihabitans rhizosphaerae]|uniref:WXG100 family type VII secretion target n=1 Tax=Herbihabitans rhizosphaerae TaxID=1872711 RepID=A0A4Q7KNA9_9PSEU|nr:hypothetical protein [Herbihabitans rhizosphaerae]RZS37121.1 hypothetical protein EV193_106359 [Herbihabitans rhizosphaerae]
MAEGFSHEITDRLKEPSPVDHPDSGKILDKLDRYKKMCDKDRWGFIYGTWRKHVAASPSDKGKWAGVPSWGESPDDSDGEGGKWWKLKIINYRAIDVVSERLIAVNFTTLSNVPTVVGQLDKNLDDAWNGQASEAARKKFQPLTEAAKEHSRQGKHLVEALNGAARNSKTAIEKLCNFFETGDGKRMVDKYKELGEDGNGHHRRNLLREWMDAMHNICEGGGGWGIDKTDRETWGEKESGDSDWIPVNWEEFAKPYVDDQSGVYLDKGCDDTPADIKVRELNEFCNDYYSMMKSFRQLVDTTVEAVAAEWRTLRDMCGAGHVPGDPYKTLQLEAPKNDPGKNDPGKNDPGKTDPGKTDPGKTDPGKTDSGGNGSQDTGQQKEYTPQDVPKAQVPGDTNGDGKPDTPGDANGDGKPDMPGDADGDGKPDAPQGKPETVTIKHGDSTITMSSPDGSGHVKLTVDNGTGPPKTYDVDFGAATGQNQGQPGVPGQPGMPIPMQGRDGAVPGQGGPGGIDGPPLMLDENGNPLPQPSQGPGAPVPGAPVPGELPVQPGPDGKAVIQDGDMTITVDQAGGPDSPVSITVDDGEGPPSTYTVENVEGQDSPQGVAERVPADQQHVLPSLQTPNDPMPVAPGPATVDGPGGAGPGGGGGAEPAAAASAGAPGPSEQLTNAATQGGTALEPGGSVGAAAPGSMGAAQAGMPGEAGLASAPGGGQGAAAGGQGMGGMGMGGMPMMGGMGGGGGGEDNERQRSQWTTEGNLFDDDTPVVKGGVIGQSNK